MEKHYFTFGQVHVHSVNGITWDKDCVCCIEATDSDAARQIMFETFGNKWAMQYGISNLHLEHYPRGIINLQR